MTHAPQSQASSFTSRIGWFPLSAITAAAAVALGLTACGGGGTGTSTSSSGGGATTASYTGTVTGLGSIVVNGVRFSTSGADTVDADDPTQPFTKPFGLGATVTVTGTVNADGTTGTATSITVHGGVRGQVTKVNCTGTDDATNGPASSFTVDGQVVKFDNTTVWDGTTANFSCATLVASTSYVEAFGVLDPTTGVVTASRVEEKTSNVVSAEGFAFRGQVSNVDTTGKTFDLTIRNGVIAHVTYTDATVLPNGATLDNGFGVRIIVSQQDATALAQATSGTTVSVTANKTIVKRERQSDGVKTVMVGAIKTISDDLKTWTIGDATIDVSQSPELEGVDLATITVGTVVKVEGKFTNGVLVAKSIESRAAEKQKRELEGIKLFGMSSAKTVDGTNATKGSFVVQGVKVTILASSSLNLPDDGSYVEVKAHNDATYGAVADELHTAQQVSTTPRSFEVYGSAACPTGTAADFTADTGFSLTLRDGTATVLGANATVSLGRGVTDNTNSPSVAVPSTMVCLVEVTGTLDATLAHTIDATKIEVKARGTSGSGTVSLR